MKLLTTSALRDWIILVAIGSIAAPACAHDPRAYAKASQAPAASAAAPRPVPGISGQGKMRFRVLYTSERLPQEARQVLVKAHGGFAVDRRPGRGETYFALPGAGILQISADLKSVRGLDTSEDMKRVNLHNTTLWYTPEGVPYLVFPANDAGKVFTTTLDGKLVHTLNAPTGDEDFEQPEIDEYFLGGGNFAPTDV
ncbi:MAG: hypothetical protein DMG26_15685, partial [Acidobacteria bacterium]